MHLPSWARAFKDAMRYMSALGKSQKQNEQRNGGSMSISVMSQCWDKSLHAGSELLMLLAIADFSDDNGRAYPAVGTLAKKCRMQRRNVQYILRTLVQSGELSVESNKGPPPKFPNLYRVNLDSLGVQSGAPVQSGVRRGALQRTKGAHSNAPKPSVTTNNRHALRFDEFWEVYPNRRKGSKLDCIKKWKSGNLDGDADRIVAHVRVMTKSKDWLKQDGEYIPAPLTYLNQRRWDGAVFSEVDARDHRFEGAS